MSIADHSKETFQREPHKTVDEEPRFRVLVVDDELSILELVKTALEMLEDYDVLTASSAADAFEIIREEDVPFDCVLLDIQMPDIDGIELLADLRVLPEYAETSVIMLTAMSDREYIEAAFRAGASDFINKPFDFHELRSRIKCAHELVQARQAAAKSTEILSKLKLKTAEVHQFSFDDPISIGDADSFLRNIEFENYISQLARAKIFGSYAVSVMLRDARLFYDLAGSTKFPEAIRSMAYAIQRATEQFDCVFSYRGGGIFPILVHGTRSSDNFLKSSNFRELFGARIRHYIDDDRIKVLLSDPVSMQQFSRTAAKGAIGKSVTALHQIEEELQNRNELPSTDSVGHSQGVKPTPEERFQERLNRAGLAGGRLI
jgi:DNA-binding response OmpR family regulator